MISRTCSYLRNRLAGAVAIFAAAVGFPPRVSAYPQYSARYNTVSCTACHLSPVGGGPRTIAGKLFGAHGYTMNKFLAQDYVSGDFRLLLYLPKHLKTSRGGMGTMNGSVGGHVALDEKNKIHFVIEHNLAGFSAAPTRDTYLLYQFHPRAGTPHAWVTSLLAGRFRMPFGIGTDEHRTYTRMQTASEIYTYETGILASGDPPFAPVHYDLGVVSGTTSTGQALSPGQGSRWGSLVNLRWLPGSLLLGTSASYHERDGGQPERVAGSLYAILSIARITDETVPLTLEVEHAQARNWNTNLPRGFIANPDYAAEIAATSSAGWLISAEWAVTPRFVALYKFDHFTPDRGFPADYFLRHGIGFRWYAGPNLIVQARTEVAKATPPSEAKESGTGNESASFALLQLAF